MMTTPPTTTPTASILHHYSAETGVGAPLAVEPVDFRGAYLRVLSAEPLAEGAQLLQWSHNTGPEVAWFILTVRRCEARPDGKFLITADRSAGVLRQRRETPGDQQAWG